MPRYGRTTLKDDHGWGGMVTQCAESIGEALDQEMEWAFKLVRGHQTVIMIDIEEL